MCTLRLAFPIFAVNQHYTFTNDAIRIDSKKLLPFYVYSFLIHFRKFAPTSIPIAI